MIRTFGSGPSEAYNSYLSRIERDAFLESTGEGWDYFVGDPELMGGESLVVGKILSTSDLVDIELVFGEDIPEPSRKAMAAICARSAGQYDRYSLARSADEVLQTLDPQIYQLTVQHIGKNLLNHKRGLSHPAGSEIHPLTKDTIVSSLGWLALRRSVNERGSEAIASLEVTGLYIPDFDSDLRLAGIVKGVKGAVPVGIVCSKEKSEKHKCGCCGGQILRTTDRITMSLDNPKGRFDHHHYHPNCFAEVNLPKLDLTTCVIAPNPYALAQSSRKSRK